ncbi:MAG TPA: DinB family protein [Terracidiphilus sp.]|nr:DinB family protein [Terracidiphilus sp.]
MNELQLSLVGDAYAASPSHILEALPEALTHRKPAGAPHSIYEELWHVCFWQQITLDWVHSIETPFPASPADGFPTVQDMEREPWPQLHERFFLGAEQGADAAGEESRLNELIRCPSRPGRPVRVMSVREQLESLSAHNAYHLGRIVLLRQLLGAWPPPRGGFGW